MQFCSPTTAHLSELVSWFDSADGLASWAGPGISYPIEFDSFKEKLKLASLESFSMVSMNEKLLGFGQCYERLGCCHLGRLAIAPSERGKNLIAQLVAKLSKHGSAKFQTNTISLFVLKNNNPAIKAYEKLGFRMAYYPETMPIPACYYMRKPLS